MTSRVGAWVEVWVGGGWPDVFGDLGHEPGKVLWYGKSKKAKSRK